MPRFTIILWLLLGTAMAGLSVAAIMITPALDRIDQEAIRSATFVAYLIGFPLAVALARWVGRPQT
ncbi:hypothetical protein [Prosthecomicrobium sp. N25]|uniref:hypothetical protein n=1 Tax=Prosthecomicrobium sp. N25 TaxID=3129254 RepID=UPI003076C00F